MLFRSDGYVHLCNSVESAAGFVAVRDFVSLKGISVKTEEGIETVVVDRQRHNHACVIAVSTVALDIDKLSINERDASAVEAGALPSDLVSYRYAEPIAVQHVVYLDDVHRGEKRLHQCFEP